MGYGQINNFTDQMIAKQKAKLAAEKTALNGCRPDLSDVTFTVGGGSDSMPYLIGSLLIIAPVTLRLLLRRRLFGDSHERSMLNITFGVIIAVCVLIAVIYMIAQSRKAKLNISGKTLFYKGNCWESSEITKLLCTSSFQLRLYAGDKKIAAVAWDESNTERLVAWAYKCGITVEDHRKFRFD